MQSRDREAISLENLSSREIHIKAEAPIKFVFMTFYMYIDIHCWSEVMHDIHNYVHDSCRINHLYNRFFSDWQVYIFIYTVYGKRKLEIKN